MCDFTPPRDHINLRNSRYRLDFTPIESDCDCLTCAHFTKGYIHHLLKAQELLAFTLITTHNVRYMNRLLEAIRQAIQNDRLEEEARNWLTN
jgi:queuine tRNA-ribosyltransferase